MLIYFFYNHYKYNLENPDEVKIIAYHNKVCRDMNRNIRKRIYDNMLNRLNRNLNQIEIGDWLICRDTYYIDNKPIIYNGQDKVNSVRWH
jgi:hypothetical protein